MCVMWSGYDAEYDTELVAVSNIPTWLLVPKHWTLENGLQHQEESRFWRRT